MNFFQSIDTEGNFRQLPTTVKGVLRKLIQDVQLYLNPGYTGSRDNFLISSYIEGGAITDLHLNDINAFEKKYDKDDLEILSKARQLYKEVKKLLPPKIRESEDLDLERDISVFLKSIDYYGWDEIGSEFSISPVEYGEVILSAVKDYVANTLFIDEESEDYFEIESIVESLYHYDNINIEFYKNQYDEIAKQHNSEDENSIWNKIITGMKLYKEINKNKLSETLSENLKNLFKGLLESKNNFVNNCKLNESVDWPIYYSTAVDILLENPNISIDEASKYIYEKFKNSKESRLKPSRYDIYDIVKIVFTAKYLILYPKSTVKEAEDYISKHIDSGDFYSKTIDKFDKKPINVKRYFERPLKRYRSNLQEGGPRKHIPSDIKNRFIHSVLIIPEAEDRQSEIDAIFDEIKEKNTESYLKAHPELTVAEAEDEVVEKMTDKIEQNLKEGLQDKKSTIKTILSEYWPGEIDDSSFRACVSELLNAFIF